MKNEGLPRSNKSSMIVTNLVRLALIILYIRGFIVKDHTQDFLIILTFFMTYYPSILKKRFGVHLPNRLQVTVTLFIFAAQVLGEMRGFYDKFSWWDTMLHMTSGIILGLVGFLFVYLLNEKGDANVNLKPSFSCYFCILFCYNYGCILGVF